MNHHVHVIALHNAYHAILSQSMCKCGSWKIHIGHTWHDYLEEIPSHWESFRVDRGGKVCWSWCLLVGNEISAHTSTARQIYNRLPKCLKMAQTDSFIQQAFYLWGKGNKSTLPCSVWVLNKIKYMYSEICLDRTLLWEITWLERPDIPRRRSYISI